MTSPSKGQSIGRDIPISDITTGSNIICASQECSGRNFWYWLIFVKTVKRTRWRPFFIIFIVIFYLFSPRLQSIMVYQLLQQSSLFSHLQFSGSCKQDGHIIEPQPTQVLSDLLHPQCLHPQLVNSTAPHLLRQLHLPVSALI